MSDTPLMPKATAVWLVDNTALTFAQIADFCKLHPLEVKGIADGEVAIGIKGSDPVTANQITRDEIEKGEKDPSHKLQMAKSKIIVPASVKRRGPKYTPVSRRQDRPDAISWLLRYHPELADSQIMKIVGTTKTTINAIRDRSHWNSTNLKPVDPVTLGLCSQLELDLAVRKAAKRVEKAGGQVKTLMPAEETVPPPYAIADTQVDANERDKAPSADEAFKGFTNTEPAQEEQEDDVDADSVFAKLKGFKTNSSEQD
ncbi:MAG: cell cycle transcriptional regulator TrcR [Anderseniella sp.]